MNEDELYSSLVLLLKLFKNRPYHLSKFLIENSALSNEFINSIKSGKIQEMSLNIENPMNFSNISEMNDFYNSLTNTEDNFEKLNEKMIYLIKNEKFEDAASLRDYMIEKKIKRN